MQETWVWSMGWEDSLSGEEKGYLLQYCGMENSMDYIVLGLQSWTWLSEQFEQVWITY